jgi:hypothetical protein
LIWLGRDPVSGCLSGWSIEDEVYAVACQERLLSYGFGLATPEELVEVLSSCG